MWGKLSSCVTSERQESATLRRVFLLGLAVCFYAVGGSSAKAQLYPEYHFLLPAFPDTVPRGETVRSRQRPELDALGLHVGPFFIFPSLTNGLTYDDNVFATDGNEEGDFLYTLSPNVTARSDWNRHALAASAGGNFGFYFSESDENFQDARAALDGRLDILASTQLFGHVDVSREHEARSDPNDVGGSEPTIFHQITTRLEGIHRFNRLSVALGNTVQYINYDDTPTAGGGNIENDQRDRFVLRPALQLGYDVHPGYQAFIRGEGKFLRYKNSVAPNGIQQDSDGFDVVAGAALDLTGLIFGDFFVGYRERHFDDSRFKTIRGPVVGSKLT